MTRQPKILWLSVCFFLLSLSQCSNGSFFSIGGTFNGLKGSMKLMNTIQSSPPNGPIVTEELVITGADGGTFGFNTKLPTGSAYTVSISQQPATKNCVVTRGTGTVADKDVTNVTVACSNPISLYSVGGTVTGLDGESMVLENSNEELSIEADGEFAFVTKYQSGTQYDVTIKTAPATKICNVANGIGQIVNSDITAINIECSDPVEPTYTIGGVASGLGEASVIVSNDTVQTIVSTDGPLTLNGSFVEGSSYNVIIDKGPTTKTCEITNGSGTVGDANITNLQINCINKWIMPNDLNDFISLDSDNDTSHLQAVMNGVGDVVLSWVQATGTGHHILVSERINGVWNHPTSLSNAINPVTSQVNEMALAMNEAGNAMLVWSQSNAGSQCIYKSERRSGVWTHPVNADDHISPSGKDAFYPSVAISDNEDVLIAWEQGDSPGFLVSEQPHYIYTSTHTSGIWTHPTDLSDYTAGFANKTAIRPVLTIDDSGNAVMAWHQYFTVSSEQQIRFFLSDYVNGVWTHPATEDDFISYTNHSTIVRLKGNGDGDIVMSWLETVGSYDRVFRAQRVSGSWSFPTDMNDFISLGDNRSASIGLDISSNGDSIIVWNQTGLNNRTQVFKSEYRSGSWTDPSTLQDGINVRTRDAMEPAVAINASGQALLSWRSLNYLSRNQLYIGEYQNGAWIFPELESDNLSPDGRSVTTNTGPLLNNLGHAVIPWQQIVGSDVKRQVFVSERTL